MGKVVAKRLYRTQRDPVLRYLHLRETDIIRTVVFPRRIRLNRHAYRLSNIGGKVETIRMSGRR